MPREELSVGSASSGRGADFLLSIPPKSNSASVYWSVRASSPHLNPMDVDALGHAAAAKRQLSSDSDSDEPDDDRDGFDRAKHYRVDGTLGDDEDNAGSNNSLGNGPRLRCMVTPACSRLGQFSVADYETHVARFHTNVCSVCRRLLPTPHFLSLHIEECHDSFFAARAARGDRCYRCFAANCGRAFRHPDKRKRHLVDKHGYPEDTYNWDVALGIRQREGVAGTAKEFGSPKNVAMKPAATGAAKNSKDRTDPSKQPSQSGTGIQKANDAPKPVKDPQKPPQPNPSNRSPSPDSDTMEADDLSRSISRLVIEPRSDVMKRHGRGAHSAFYVPRTAHNEKPVPKPKEEGWGDGRIGFEYKRAVPRSVVMKKMGKQGSGRGEPEKEPPVEPTEIMDS